MRDWIIKWWKRWRAYEKSLPCPHGRDDIGDSIIWTSIARGRRHGVCGNCGKEFGTKKGEQ